MNIADLLSFSRLKNKPAGAQSDQNLSSEFILGAIEDGVVMVGGDNVLHLFNQAAGNITGWKTNEALGLDYRSVLMFADEHGQAYAAERDPFSKALHTRNTVRDDKIMLRTRANKMVP